ncbi:acyl carrier protein [Paenibacillus endoradicis]|uniref:acyl carrier protein n=1 Tax=Paenibacillus endoradicis TaxID=2972487 RepID=UPI002158C0CD|nr:phosphopantetheine-binding protein [Paenibacillus endoradicis]MCR8657743.1 phosphopantetheine-binding protein [Paenibacillus endoradicis]
MVRNEIFDVVQQSLVDAIGVDLEEVAAESTLLGDLGAESLDLLDVLFRIERKLGFKVTMNDITMMITGGIPDEQFGTDEGYISDLGLEKLKENLPQIDMESLRGKFEAERVLTLFTVDNLVSLVEKRQAELSTVS